MGLLRQSQLELGTKPPDLSHADDGTGEGGEGEMEVGAALVADAEAPETGEPGEGSFHDPPVPAKMGAALHAASRDPWLDPTGPALPAAASVIVALVGVQLVRALAWPTASPGPHAWQGVQSGHQCTGPG